MRVVSGTVVSGRIVLDDAEFLDGTHVVVVSCDKEDKIRQCKLIKVSNYVIVDGLMT